jgi:hypothetical protein
MEVAIDLVREMRGYFKGEKVDYFLSLLMKPISDSELLKNESRSICLLTKMSRLLSELKKKGKEMGSLALNLLRSIVDGIPVLSKFEGPVREL